MKAAQLRKKECFYDPLILVNRAHALENPMETPCLLYTSDAADE